MNRRLESIKISPQAFLAVSLAKNRGVRILDVRERGEYERAHLPGAENAPLSSFLNWKNRLDSEEYLYLYAEEERGALLVAEKLISRHPNLWVLEGGFQRWKTEGLPVEEQTE